MDKKLQTVVPIVILPREYHLYRWYSLMKQSNNKIGDYIKYAIFCKLSGIECCVGRVSTLCYDDGDEKKRTSITISPNDGIVNEWIKNLNENQMVRKSTLIKSILENSLVICDRKEDEYIPNYAELTFGITVSKKYQRYSQDDIGSVIDIKTGNLKTNLEENKVTDDAGNVTKGNEEEKRTGTEKIGDYNSTTTDVRKDASHKGNAKEESKSGFSSEQTKKSLTDEELMAMSQLLSNIPYKSDSDDD